MREPGRLYVSALARGLGDALARALAPAADAHAFTAACDAAGLLGLRGLERLLAAAGPADRDRPAGAEAALDRVRRTLERAAAGEALAEFRAADEGFAALARELGPPAWARPGPRVEGESVALADVLGDWPVSHRDRLRAARARLEPPVAAALRAALDWLTDEATARLPLRVAVEDAVLAIVVERARPADPAALDALLHAVGACAVPGGTPGGEHAPPGSFVLRLPLVAERALHLMLHAGAHAVAVPWPNVLRFYLVPRVEIEARRTSLDVPVLEPLGALDAGPAERPVVLVGLGLRRGYLVADRLVWRLPASPCEPEGSPPDAGPWRAVKGEDGGRFWAADPAWLLRAVAPPAPAPPPAPAAEPAAVASVPAAEAAPARAAAAPAEVAPAPAAEAAPARSPALPASAPAATAAARPAPLVAPPPAAAPYVLGEADVEPIESAPPVPIERPAAAAGWNPFPAGWAPETRRRALLAEDSITAGIFLARMLEQRAFEVRLARTAAELLEALARGGPWSLVCVDVELPDARGAALVRDVGERLGAAGTPLVALVRDADDVAAARAGGVAHTLRKPFDQTALDDVLDRAGLPRGPAR